MAQLRRGTVLRHLDYLLADEPSRTSHAFTAQVSEFREENSRWATNEALIGYGFIIGGDFFQSRRGHATVTLYTDSESNSSSLQRRVPKKLTLPGDQVFPTQVVNIGSVTPLSYTDKRRPAQPGYSVSHCEMPSGTLGLAVIRSDRPEKRYILSNNHVLTKFGRLQYGDKVIQPGTSDDGTEKDAIALLHEAVPLHYDDRRFLNTVDAAIAEVIDDEGLVSEIAGLGEPKGIGSQIRRGMIVRKAGRTSAVSVGEVRDPSARIRLRYPRDKNSTSIVGFEDVVVCSPFSQKGDSGSAVLNRKNEVVGLVMAGSDMATVFCKVANIFEKLTIRLFRSR